MEIYMEIEVCDLHYVLALDGLAWIERAHMGATDPRSPGVVAFERFTHELLEGVHEACEIAEEIGQ